MKLNKSNRDHSLQFNMTPMIDIVFLLIIFFMTVSQITRSSEQPLDLPVVNRGSDEVKSANITVNIQPDGTILTGSRKVAIDEVVVLVKQALAEVDSDPTRVRILIRCDRDAKSKTANQLFRELTELGFTQIRVAVTSE